MAKLNSGLVRLGRRFTRGAVLTKHFADLADARNWIFGGGKEEARTGFYADT
jgi:hypothetical protein